MLKVLQSSPSVCNRINYRPWMVYTKCSLYKQRFVPQSISPAQHTFYSQLSFQNPIRSSKSIYTCSSHVSMGSYFLHRNKANRRTLRTHDVANHTRFIDNFHSDNDTHRNGTNIQSIQDAMLTWQQYVRERYGEASDTVAPNRTSHSPNRLSHSIHGTSYSTVDRNSMGHSTYLTDISKTIQDTSELYNTREICTKDNLGDPNAQDSEKRNDTHHKLDLIDHLQSVRYGSTCVKSFLGYNRDDVDACVTWLHNRQYKQLHPVLVDLLQLISVHCDALATIHESNNAQLWVDRTDVSHKNCENILTTELNCLSNLLIVYLSIAPGCLDRFTSSDLTLILDVLKQFSDSQTDRYQMLASNLLDTLLLSAFSGIENKSYRGKKTNQTNTAMTLHGYSTWFTKLSWLQRQELYHRLIEFKGTSSLHSIGRQHLFAVLCSSSIVLDPPNVTDVSSQWLMTLYTSLSSRQYVPWLSQWVHAAKRNVQWKFMPKSSTSASLISPVDLSWETIAWFSISANSHVHAFKELFTYQSRSQSASQSTTMPSLSAFHATNHIVIRRYAATLSSVAQRIQFIQVARKWCARNHDISMQTLVDLTDAFSELTSIYNGVCEVNGNDTIHNTGTGNVATIDKHKKDCLKDNDALVSMHQSEQNYVDCRVPNRSMIHSDASTTAMITSLKFATSSLTHLFWMRLTLFPPETAFNILPCVADTLQSIQILKLDDLEHNKPILRLCFAVRNAIIALPNSFDKSPSQLNQPKHSNQSKHETIHISDKFHGLANILLRFHELDILDLDFTGSSINISQKLLLTEEAQRDSVTAMQSIPTAVSAIELAYALLCVGNHLYVQSSTDSSIVHLSSFDAKRTVSTRAFACATDLLIAARYHPTLRVAIAEHNSTLMDVIQNINTFSEERLHHANNSNYGTSLVRAVDQVLQHTALV